MLWEPNGSSSGAVFGISATAQTLSHTVFERIHPREFDTLVPADLFRYVSTIIAWSG